jgi:hypothetical protein
VPLVRNRQSNSGIGYRIGVISDPGHLEMDGGGNAEARSRPLLLLYRISKDSTPSPGSKHLIGLFKGLDDPVDILGLVFVLPREQNRGYYQQPPTSV